MVWKEQYGKELSSSQVGRLLKGETLSLKGFLKQDGTKFDGKLKLVEAPDDKHLYRVACEEVQPTEGKKKKSTKKDDAPQ